MVLFEDVYNYIIIIIMCVCCVSCILMVLFENNVYMVTETKTHELRIFDLVSPHQIHNVLRTHF